MNLRGFFFSFGGRGGRGGMGYLGCFDAEKKKIFNLLLKNGNPPAGEGMEVEILLCEIGWNSKAGTKPPS